MNSAARLVLLCLACLAGTALAAPVAPATPVAPTSSDSAPADATAQLGERCVGTQYYVEGSVKVVPSATFAIVSYALKKPVKLSTVVFNPTDTPIESNLGIGSSPVPKTNFTVRVNGLTPGRLYTFKLLAPDPDCPGKDMIVGNPTLPAVTTWKRRVTFTVTKIKMVDDSDGITCGDIVSLKALIRLPSVKGKDGKVVDNELELSKTGTETTICSGDNYYPPTWRGKKTFDNVVDETYTAGFGALDDDTTPFELASYGWGIPWGSDFQSGQVEQANKVFPNQKLPGINANDVPGVVTRTYKVLNDSPKFEATLYVKTTYVKP